VCDSLYATVENFVISRDDYFPQLFCDMAKIQPSHEMNKKNPSGFAKWFQGFISILTLLK